ncbi:DinB family protein [bacterium]|nr:DinB family protein [bacterium]
MDLESVIEQLDYQAEAIVAMAEGLSQHEADWRPAAEEWSVRQVFAHLVREEIVDFRRYLLGAFKDKAPDMDLLKDFEVEEGQYELAELLEMFITEREQSLDWLAELDEPDWDLEVEMHWGGTLKTGDILVSWTAHDLLHLRQLVALRFGITEAAGKPYSIQYAGEW